MNRSARASLAPALTLLALVGSATGAAATDLFVVTTTGDVESVPFPAGAPNSVLVPAGTSGMSMPTDAVIGPDGYLYVTSFATDEVLRFEPDGDVDCGFAWPAIAGFTGPSCLVFDPISGHLLVGGSSCGRVVRIDVSSGVWWDEFTAFADGLQTPSGLSFHPQTGRLLIADHDGDKIWDACFAGSFELCTFVAPGSTGIPDPTGLDGPTQMLWRNNELYVTSTASQQVRRYFASGVYLDAVAPRGTEVPAAGTLRGIAIGPNGRLYVGDPDNSRVLEYTVPVAFPASTYLGVFASALQPLDLLFHNRPAAPFPLPLGTVVATYCPDLVFDPFVGVRPDPTKPALIAVDARADGPVGRNWIAPKFWNEDAVNPADVWNAGNLGSVFGICFDRAGNLFVTSTSAYGVFPPGVYPNGPGAVYKIAPSTGAISLFLGTNPVSSVALAATPGTTTLPNTGPGLGDITYDPHYDVFYVSNLEDGRIYIVEDTGSGGVVQRAFDPFGNDELIDGTPGFPARGERIYAVHSVNARVLLWSGWLRDRANPSVPWPTTAPTVWPPLPGGAAPNNTVFRSLVTMEPGTLQPILNGTWIWKVMPHLAGSAYSNPVTDITDNSNSDGPVDWPTRYLVAERTFNGDYGSLQDGSSAHGARVLEYTGAIGFPASPNQFFVGDEAFSPSLRNCAGGVAYEADDDVWSTGDALDLRGSPWCHLAYGLERIPWWGNAISPESVLCNIIDLDEFTGYYNKSQSGDVESVHFPVSYWGDVFNVCSGDLWALCPCANPGSPGSGCANSANPNGALLTATGNPSVSADTILLQAEGLPSSSSLLYFQGTTVIAGGAGTEFGDGLRCAGGTVIRLSIQNSSFGVSSYPSTGEPSLSVKGLVVPGDFRTYQVWYRNAAAFCTAATFNLTNALATTWQP